MEFFDLIASRRSVRKFLPRPLPAGALDRILEAVRLAPTAGNLQAFRILVVQERELLSELAAASHGQSFVAEAPVLLAFLAATTESGREYGGRGRDLYALQDATIAALYAHLAAADLGLGSVWVGAFHTPTVTALLGQPDDLVPVALLPLGVPGEFPEPRPRKPLSDLAGTPAARFPDVP